MSLAKPIALTMLLLVACGGTPASTISSGDPTMPAATSDAAPDVDPQSDPSGDAGEPATAADGGATEDGGTRPDKPGDGDPVPGEGGTTLEDGGAKDPMTGNDSGSPPIMNDAGLPLCCLPEGTGQPATPCSQEGQEPSPPRPVGVWCETWANGICLVTEAGVRLSTMGQVIVCQ